MYYVGYLGNVPIDFKKKVNLHNFVSYHSPP